MCGVFGWVGHNRMFPEPDLMHEAASGAAARGPHGHGWAALGAGLTVHRDLGALTPDQVPVDAHRVIGHSRLATSGDPSDLAATHPISRDGHHLVHNGTCEEALPLALGEPSDSAALATVYARLRGAASPVAALSDALAAVRAEAWAVLLLDATGDILATASGLPLWARPTATGVYLSSRRLDGAYPIGAQVRRISRPQEARCA